ncbi:MAG: elongation factor [Clostridiales bacterium]|jgi:elongation factor G|nr:translation elongation factor 2 [Oscillospiraceae bacterium]MDN5378384.1 elongation factor [Clostridiales bacterium]
MKQYDALKIKNIALAGHAGSGKTSLAEALLFKAGASERLGKVADGNTVMDFDSEEIKRKATLNTSLASFEYDGNKVNLIDTPGLFDFEGGMIEGIYACSTAMITVSAKSGVKVGTEKAYDFAVKTGKSRMFVVTKLDEENADFYKVLAELKTVFGPSVCPVVVPTVRDGKIVSYVNLIEMKAYTYDEKGNAVETQMPDSEYRLDGLITAVSEAVAETDEELFEKYFSGEKFTQKEIVKGIHKGMNEGKITPVTCVSSFTLGGVDMLLKEISLLVPAAAEHETNMASLPNGDLIEISTNESDPLSAVVFKTVADPFVGKMSYIKVISGKLSANSEVLNASSGNTEKIGKLYSVFGKKQEETAFAIAGDIVAASKLSANTMDTLCDPSRPVKFEKIEFPKPCFSMAVKAKSQGDETKISAGIQRLLEEDLTLSYVQDDSTKEQVLSGLGEQHIEVACAKLKSKFGADVELKAPKIAYRETITKKVKVQGKYKKQSGGHGQYGDVWIEFEPYVGDELVFEERVFGGAVPKNFFPAVEKGLQECVKKGVLAGYPVVGLKAILVDGSYHPVDSSELSFKVAASIAYKDGLKQAEPVILEPVDKLSAIVPDENTGDIMGDLNKRRGRVLGMTPVGKGMTEIAAEVPHREMQNFTTVLRQITRGKGYFSLEFLRYERLPANLVSEVILSADSAEE